MIKLTNIKNTFTFWISLCLVCTSAVPSGFTLAPPQADRNTLALTIQGKISIPSHFASKKPEDWIQGFEELSDPEKQRVRNQFNDINLKEFILLVKEAGTFDSDRMNAAIAHEDMEPAIPKKSNIQANETGTAAYKHGRVGVMLMCGGSGLRLGFSGSKGNFPTTPVKRRTLYKKFAREVLALSLHYGHDVPFVIMTSDETDIETRKTFEINNYFGLKKTQVYFIKQRSYPVIDQKTFKMILNEDKNLFMGGFGHGEIFYCLRDKELKKWLHNFGVEQLQIVQIDNALAPLREPAFIGEHILDGKNRTSKKPGPHMSYLLVIKQNDFDNFGHIFYDGNGNRIFIEYIYVTKEQAAINHYGSPNIIIVELDSILDTMKLPVRIAKKKTADHTGQKKDLYKYETFLFEAPDSWGIEFEMPQEDVFASLKNKAFNDQGVPQNESIVTSQYLQNKFYARKLGEFIQNISYPRNASGVLDCKVELGPEILLLEEKDKKLRFGHSWVFEEGSQVAIEGFNTRIGSFFTVDKHARFEIICEDLKGKLTVGNGVTIKNNITITIEGDGWLIIRDATDISEDITVSQGEIKIIGDKHIPQAQLESEAQALKQALLIPEARDFKTFIAITREAHNGDIVQIKYSDTIERLVIIDSKLNPQNSFLKTAISLLTGEKVMLRLFEEYDDDERDLPCNGGYVCLSELKTYPTTHLIGGRLCVAIESRKHDVSTIVRQPFIEGKSLSHIATFREDEISSNTEYLLGLLIIISKLSSSLDSAFKQHTWSRLHICPENIILGYNDEPYFKNFLGWQDSSDKFDADLYGLFRLIFSIFKDFRQKNIDTLIEETIFYRAEDINTIFKNRLKLIKSKIEQNEYKDYHEFSKDINDLISLISSSQGTVSINKCIKLLSASL